MQPMEVMGKARRGETGPSDAKWGLCMDHNLTAHPHPSVISSGFQVPGFALSLAPQPCSATNSSVENALISRWVSAKSNGSSTHRLEKVLKDAEIKVRQKINISNS